MKKISSRLRRAAILILSVFPPISCPVCTPMCFPVCCADSLALLSVLSCLVLSCQICLQVCGVVFLFVFCFNWIHVLLVLCRTCPHLVSVFVFKYPLKTLEVVPFCWCANKCAETEWWGMIAWMSAVSLVDSRRTFVSAFVCRHGCAVLSVCARIQQRHIALCTFLAQRWQWLTVPLKDRREVS